jgi:hypothetical protein
MKCFVLFIRRGSKTSNVYFYTFNYIATKNNTLTSIITYFWNVNTWKLEDSDILGYGAALIGNQFFTCQKNAACTSSGIFSDLHALRNISNELHSNTVSCPRRLEPTTTQWNPVYLEQITSNIGHSAPKRHINYSYEMVYNNILGKICNFDCNYLRIYNNSSNGSRGSVVGMVTRLRTGRSGFRIVAGLRDFYLLYTCPERLWGPPSLLFNGHRCSLSGLKRPGRNVNLWRPFNAKVKSG